MLKKFLLAIAAIVIVLACYVAVQPAEFRILRSATIAAPPAVVFAQVNDFHNWQAWSPWARLDPQATNSFEGPESGVGAVFHWSGNDQVGEGSMKLVESRPNDFIQIRLQFVRPLAASNTAEFTFQPEGGGTRVTWGMSGHNGFVGRAICLIMNVDKMVGREFEQGLKNLDAVSVAAVKK